jgi:hypothetical protein
MESIRRSERWFSQQGAWLLWSSRFVPGTRLPTYLAAGFLRLSFAKFLLITGSAVALWTVAIFTIARIAGARVLEWSREWQSGGWILVALAVALFVLFRFAIRFFRKDIRRRIISRVLRWTHWEFWPGWLFYAPVAAHYLWLAIRHRGLTVPTAANPGIFSGGFVGESKIATLEQLQQTSPRFTAEAFAIRSGDSQQRRLALERLIENGAIQYPFVLKPDVGQRGIGVKIIRKFEEGIGYLEQTATAAVIAQRYVPGPDEMGIFYFRYPHQERGRIFAITEKRFPTITGDGVNTVEELIWRDPRASLIADRYLTRHSGRKQEILPEGVPLKLVEAGNHAQGCIFRNGWSLWSRELEDRIDEISRQLDRFFVGRYDIRFSSEADLRQGRNFQIIELNGAASEATSIYDARNSIWTAWRTLFAQWRLVFTIGAINRRRGVLPTTIRNLWAAWRNSVALAKNYPAAD